MRASSLRGVPAQHSQDAGVRRQRPAKGARNRADWFYHQRWTGDGICPRDGLPLQTATIGSRTTRWLRRCQR